MNTAQKEFHKANLERELEQLRVVRKTLLKKLDELDKFIEEKEQKISAL